jgi:hypothetical protein
MLELLREHQLSQRFRKLKKTAPKFVVAVPFWGNGALTSLGINGKQKSRIICNLQSSACNPYVIEQLKKSKGVSVRSHPRLHAKIYATDKFAIIGSSNASTNGLAVEGQPKSWIEANVISDDPNIVTGARALFQELWVSPETLNVTKTALTEAKKRWDARPKPQVPVTATSLLAACREQPDLFTSVYLAAYKEKLGPEGSQKLKDFKKSQRPFSSSLGEKDIKGAWGYQFEKMPEGVWLVDFDCTKDAPKFNGYARVTSPRVAFEMNGDEEALVIAIRQSSINPASSLQSFKLSKSDREAIIKNKELLLSKDGLIPLKKVVQIIDGAA